MADSKAGAVGTTHTQYRWGIQTHLREMELPQNSGHQNSNMKQVRKKNTDNPPTVGPKVKKFSRPGEVPPGICARKKYWVLICFMRIQNSKGNRPLLKQPL